MRGNLPPYWALRDYNIPDQICLDESLPQFINSLRTVFGEMRRVLRDDGVFWLNIGDGYTSGNRKWRAPDKKTRHGQWTCDPILRMASSRRICSEFLGD